MTNEKRATSRAIGQLLEKLGKVETVETLEFALPLIIEREAILRESLLSGSLPEAIQCAHKTVSSIRLYGSSELEDLLQAVKAVENHQQALKLQPQLSKEFNRTIDGVRDWLQKANA